MRDRLLNPKNLKIDLEALQVTIIDDVKYRVFTEKYTYTQPRGCQCFKDCDCSEDYGKVTHYEKTWYRNTEFDGTDKCFYSEPYTPTEYVL